MDRLPLGFRGLGLRRGWSFQDPEEADAEVEAMARILSSSVQVGRQLPAGHEA
jgi:hypothetical protein